MAAIDLIASTKDALANIQQRELRHELAEARSRAKVRVESRKQEFLALVHRAVVVEGESKSRVAEAAGVERQTVYNWLREFAALDGETVAQVQTALPDTSTAGAAGGTIVASDIDGLWLVTDPGGTFTAKVKANGYPEYDFRTDENGDEVPILPTDAWLAWNAANRQAIIDVIGGTDAAAA